MNINSICAIVVTYNSGKSYAKNFNAIKGQLQKIIIVDNGSDLQTVETLKSLGEQNPTLEVIYNNSNIGLAKAQNIGIKHAINLGYEWIMFLDDDSHAKDDMLIQMKNFYDKWIDKESIAILAPNIINLPYFEDNVYIACNKSFFKMRQGFNDQKYIDVYYAIASGSLIKSVMFEKIGYFKDNFFIDYIDIEYSLRAHINGYKTIIVRDAYLEHRLGMRKQIKFAGFSIVTLNHNYIRKFYIFRNRIKVWKIYMFKTPKFVIYDILTSGMFFLIASIFEENRLKKILYMFKGIFIGLFTKSNKG